MSNDKKKLTPKELAQRRTAARKHGQYATSPARQVFPACNRRQCPLNDFPCQLRQAADRMNHVLEVCPMPLVTNPEVKEAYIQALTEGDPSKLTHISATALAAQQEFYEDELAKLKEDGIAIEEDVFSKDGELLATRKVLHPATWPVFKLAEIQGHTAHQQAITPKAAGERKRDEGIGGMFDQMKKMQDKFGTTAEPKLLTEAG